MRRRKRAVGRNWSLDETYIKISGEWKYLYRAIDKCGDTVAFLLIEKRDKAAARSFLERAIGLHDIPEKITIDKSGANTAAIESVKADSGVHIAYALVQISQTTWSSKTTTGPSSESPDTCLASSHSGVPESLSPISRNMHMIKEAGALPRQPNYVRSRSILWTNFLIK